MVSGGVYVLTSARSGSNYFVNILNNTGLFDPIIEENFLPENKNSLLKYNKVVINKYVTDQKSGEKYPLAEHLEFIKNGEKQTPIQKNKYLTLGDVKDKYPEMKYIYLQRRDIIASTVSYFLAVSSETFRYSGYEEGVYERTFGADYKELYTLENKLRLLNTYNRVKKNIDIFIGIMKKYDIEALPVYYEDILEDKEREFSRVFKYLDIDVSLLKDALAKNTFKIQRNLNKEIYKKVETLLREMLDKLGIDDLPTFSKITPP